MALTSLKDYDHFLVQLEKQIKAHPRERLNILLKELKEVDCPYLKRKLRECYGI